ncbi:MAG: multidrug efflux pump subunit AcrB [Arenicella sp.]
MLSFLLKRPIAVFMSFLAMLIFSGLALYNLPVSLLPSLEVPKILIRASYPNASPAEIEQNVLEAIRSQLITLNNIKDVESEATNELGLVELVFEFGTDMDLAYIEVNEKIDRLQSQLPQDLPRPIVIKSNSTDIPIVKLQIQNKPTVSNPLSLVELSNLLEKVIKKRLETLKGVSVVDLNGLQRPEISITPNQNKLLALGISEQQLWQAVQNQNAELGAVSVRDGHYRYFMRLSNELQSAEDVEKVSLKLPTRSITLGELASVKMEEQKSTSYHLVNGETGFVVNLHKQNQAQMQPLMLLVEEAVAQFRKDFPQLHFEFSQNQSALLNASISNLGSSLLLGGFFAFVVLFLFMGNFRLPLIIGISLPSSLLISFWLFEWLGLSINIISLGGLALGLGMLIDNSIIVLDNISSVWSRKMTESRNLPPKVQAEQAQNPNLVQASSLESQNAPFQASGLEPIQRQELLHNNNLLFQACVEGTSQVIAPLVSSVLTTLAVFVPLVFLNGLAGAFFYEQAVAVASVLGASLLVAFVLLPLCYLLFFRVREKANSSEIQPTLSNDDSQKELVKVGFKSVQRLAGPADSASDSLSFLDNNSSEIQPITKQKTQTETRFFKAVLGVYKKAHHLVFSFPKLSFFLLLGVSPIGWLIYQNLTLQSLPTINTQDFSVSVAWNEAIDLEGNKLRSEEVIRFWSEKVSFSESDVGFKQFLVETDNSNLLTASFYFKLNTDLDKANELNAFSKWFNAKFPKAELEVSEARTAFNQLFSNRNPAFELRLSSTRTKKPLLKSEINTIKEQFTNFSWKDGKGMSLEQVVLLRLIPEKIQAYNVSYSQVIDKLKSLFGQFLISEIKTFGEVIPIRAKVSEADFRQLLNSQFVISEGNQILLANLVSVSYEEDYKSISANQSAIFQSLFLENPEQIEVDQLQKQVAEVEKSSPEIDLILTGSYFETKETLRQMQYVLLVSVLLLYFILSAQFESFWQPLIVLLTLPLAISGSLLFLWLANESINLISAIGIVVMLGIMVNDAILKIDTINRLVRKEKISLNQAITLAGESRLKPILMTSITTILALLPVLFSAGLGSDLQRPLAIAVIGGLSLGTFTAIFFVPLCFKLFKRRE